MATVLDETFDHVNVNNWTDTGYDWSPGSPNQGNPSESQAYSPDAVTVADGQLILTARPKPMTVGGMTYQYTSGMVTTSRRLSGTYASIVVRAKLPVGPGMWPAIWLLPQDYSWPPEVDIMEAQAADHVTHNLHYIDAAGHPAQTNPAPTVLDPTQFHDYGMVWKPNLLSLSVDGVEVQRTTDPTRIPHRAMYLLINLAIVGAKVTDATPWPARMVIDRVTVST